MALNEPPSKHLGFTGTSGHITELQRLYLKTNLISLYEQGFLYLHHGDCIGADVIAHYIALSLGYKIIIHPPENSYKRAFKKGIKIYDVKPYLKRNKDIVHESSKLLACPNEADRGRYLKTGYMPVRSGTWATVRYALKDNIQVIFV